MPDDVAESASAQPASDTDVRGAAFGAGGNTRFDRFVLRSSRWFATHRKSRIAAIALALTVSLTPGVVLLVFPDLTDSLEGFGYIGVFLTNLASTATFYFPVPGLTLAAQTLIATEGEDAAFPWLVGIAGGAGMAVGEVTAYYAGYLGAELVRGRELPGPRRLRPAIERAIRWINWLMNRWGMATLFVLSAVPNPAFEVAGLTAGSVRMAFRRFILSVTAGKMVRGVLLAYYGVDVFERALPFV
jgi:membrane protein DedA with SNARE-associated domain